MVKNLELITDKVQSFSFADITYIKNFNLSFLKEFNVHSSVLDIDFIVEGKDNRYLVQFRFHNPQNIHFESGGFYHQISLNIDDITERGWENMKYEVEDYEDNALSFFCAEVEVISISETIY
ncbi:hypothetical protein RRU94_16055 [Domibacillus sp. DTU_2020_1001157_1_SI_ALB_TIR_016]|uniref:hypothetical protein n=1 Tax=Domibacillus sp. DTU_2020_1001157_1_SI_ALB_TIR_016 TaxID=3077789 RepID=UPI0028ED5E29|nr:hypothetical protein [Domibacillus sp. DTU_2020_1001157_1_SI_ALB_TIR_016]WNS82250.1 hypothetical protein RRU94_16055 [Domibacillus sp. DTU_2020_1001157_1_SI_ALB_TIR_016]